MSPEILDVFIKERRKVKQKDEELLKERRKAKQKDEQILKERREKEQAKRKAKEVEESDKKKDEALTKVDGKPRSMWERLGVRAAGEIDFERRKIQNSTRSTVTTGCAKPDIVVTWEFLV